MGLSCNFNFNLDETWSPVAGGHCSIPEHPPNGGKQVIRACLSGGQGMRKSSRKGGRRLGSYMTERKDW